MKMIPLTQDKFALVDDEDYEYLNQWKWCYVNNRGGGHAARRIKISEGKFRLFYMHHLLLKPKKGFIVDHADTNGINNQRSNLRYITVLQNLMNSKKKSGSYTSKYKGVVRPKGRKLWAAQIMLDNKMFRIGGFEEEHHAALARDLWALDIHGSHTYTNFPIINPQAQ